MSIISAILQGLLQGFTEFLPVSSSGHLALYQYFTGINSEQSVLFSVMLHFGTLLAVFIAFWSTIWELIKEAFSLLGDLVTFKITKKPTNPKRKMIYMLFLSCVPLLFVLLVKDRIAMISADNSVLTEGVCFLITALFLTFADCVVKGKKSAKSMKVSDAFIIGFAQLLATLPGVSRSGSTISTGLILGFSRQYVVAYSFILGIPAVLGAGLLDLADLLSGTGAAANMDMTPALIGMAVSAVSGFFAIKLVTYIVKTDKFKIFAVYTMILGVLMVAIGLFEIFTGNGIQQFIVALIG